jgi:hypothetical protein
VAVDGKKGVWVWCDYGVGNVCGILGLCICPILCAFAGRCVIVGLGFVLWEGICLC